ncbi:MAG: 2-C-methyl-D-erythritol 2,4-cyclodiphosphate synthase [Armatimonadota bacterium]|nr:2-C-methyl-D-erythritol 2,4-cyclodiphosphate synthase [bacterium]MDW8321051.1 2-C-methyl-D-erythritol 2,4-cyclodiphosphate synthase [Armatimonadota bacterium]
MVGTYALILAAGKGERFGGTTGKLWTPVAGAPVLLWTLRAFQSHPEVNHIVLVGQQSDLPRLQQIANHFHKVSAVVQGGRERWESVRNGLEAVPVEDGWVLVHDAARAAVSAQLISRVLQTTRETGAAIPALRLPDTVKWVDEANIVRETLPRERRAHGERWQLMAVQTPQGFSVNVLRSAYGRYDSRAGIPTDDAMVVEAFHPVTVVPGDPQNIKLTYPEDLARLEAILMGGGETRTGFGYDVHPFAEGRRLVLGGVEIPAPRGLSGHSDADVVLHAITDALLGAAGMDDIGVLFPNTDPSYRNADSAELLRQAWAQIRERGWSLVNVDVTVVAETPRLRPYVAAMRERISAVLQAEVDRLNIKATTSEGMGFIGREEGIACYAVATLRR